MFVNLQVSPETLPSAETLDWQPLNSRFVRRLQTGALLRALVFAGIGAGVHYLVATGNPAVPIRVVPWLPPTAWGFFGVFCLGALVWPAIAVRYRGYAVRNRDILHKSGVLWRSVWAVPFNRVQHTRTDSTPLDRRFGLANLSVFPAGGGTHKIRGLGEETAERLRAHVSARIGAETGGETDSDVGEPT